MGRPPHGYSRGVDRQEDSYLICVCIVYVALGRESILVVAITEDQPHASPHYNLDQLLALVPPEDISVTSVGADWDRSGSWILLLPVCWRFSGPENTSHKSRALLISVRLTEVEAFTG